MADYGNLSLGVSCPGVLSDTSDYNIDGACVARGEIPFGVAVQVVEIVDGVKVVSALSDGKPYGVSMRSQYEHLSGVIQDGDPVNIISHGRVWARTSLEDSPTFGDKLSFGAGGEVSAAGEEGWPFAGGFVKFGEGWIVEVQILQNRYFKPAEPEPDPDPDPDPEPDA